MSDFDYWFFTARAAAPEAHLPLATELLYGICDNNNDRFERLCDILNQCFKAGQLKGEGNV